MGTMPFAVALARPVERIPGPGALPGGSRYEPKWDGFRALVVRDGDGAFVWSRRGTNLSAVFPEIAAAAADQVRPGTVLDGEIVVWEDGRLVFEALQERMGRGPRSAAVLARSRPASLVPFDVLASAGQDVRAEPYDRRRALLEDLATSWRPPLNLSPMTADFGEASEWFETYAAAGIEGLVVKGGAQPYRGGDRLWLKVKHRSTVDVVCGAVTGSLTAPREIVAGLPLDGRLAVVGRTTALSPAARRALAPALVPPLGDHPWPTRISPGAFGRLTGRSDPVVLVLVDPFVVEVSADVAWSGTAFRHPLRFVRARPDVAVEEVRPPER